VRRYRVFPAGVEQRIAAEPGFSKYHITLEILANSG